MNKNAFNDRNDVKWAHPDIEAEFEAGFQPFGFDDIFDETLPMDVRLAELERVEGSFAVEGSDTHDPERTKVCYAPGCVEEPDAPEVEVVISYPSEGKRKRLPLVLEIPGGGLVTCMTPCIDTEAEADFYGCAVATFRYRVALKGGGYPESINDCHAAYQYLLDHADELGINAKKIVVMGVSSGGHFTLALAHRLKRYGIAPRGCIALVPIVDDRMSYFSSRYFCDGWGAGQTYVSSRIWARNQNPALLPPEAFPNHATVEECVGLPPTFIHSCEHDSGMGPQLEYAAKLLEAGVYTSIIVWPGSNHDGLNSAAFLCFDEETSGEYPRQLRNTFKFQVADLIKHDHSRPWTLEEAGI